MLASEHSGTIPRVGCSINFKEINASIESFVRLHKPFPLPDKVDGGGGTAQKAWPMLM
jgi:hypothetical protein